MIFLKNANTRINIPSPLLTDSYKLTHSVLYPAVERLIAYGECRTAFNKDTSDARLVFYGLSYIVEQYISKKWTMEDIHATEKFCATHNAGKTQYPWPKDLFMKVYTVSGDNT